MPQCKWHALGLGLVFCRDVVGDVPLEWYKDEEHIGYDRGGSRIIKQGKADKLDSLLARNDASQVHCALCKASVHVALGPPSAL
jgi:BOP1NT (NUC169) domain